MADERVKTLLLQMGTVTPNGQLEALDAAKGLTYPASLPRPRTRSTDGVRVVALLCSRGQCCTSLPEPLQ